MPNVNLADLPLEMQEQLVQEARARAANPDPAPAAEQPPVKVLESILANKPASIDDAVARWFGAKAQTAEIKNYHLAGTSFLNQHHQAQHLGLGQAARSIGPFREVTVMAAPPAPDPAPASATATATATAPGTDPTPTDYTGQPPAGRKAGGLGWKGVAATAAATAVLGGGLGGLAVKALTKTPAAIKAVTSTVDNTKTGSVGMELE